MQRPVRPERTGKRAHELSSSTCAIHARQHRQAARPVVPARHCRFHHHLPFNGQGGVRCPRSPQKSLPLASPARSLPTPTAKQRKALQSALKPTDTRCKPAAKSEPKPKGKPRPLTKPAAATVSHQALLTNVGLFAAWPRTSNGCRQTQGAQLPVVVTALKSKKGPLTRVPGRPLQNENEAQAAAQKVKGLQADAVVVQP